ncbi:MAG: hypothetical protein KJZ65_09660 [Phycisphaerales bacterium]|nr:hypothetical protein [Phycisphaerales bacterium]
MTKPLHVAAIAVLAVCPASALAQIQNGSFELGLAYPSGLSIFTAGTPSPWFATSFTPDLYDNTGVDGWSLAGIPAYNGMFAQMLACDGNRFIGFAASATFSEAFAQTTAPLVAGQQYTLGACMAVDDLGKAAPFGGPYTGRGVVDVYLNSGYIGSFAQNTATYTWEARSITFVATSSLPATFTFVAQVDPTNGAASYMALDHIRLVPAPGAAALLGLGGVMCARRRR